MLTVFDEGYHAKEVDAKTMARGIALAEFYLTEAVRLFGQAEVSPDLAHAQLLSDWLRDNPDTTGWYLTLKRIVDPFGASAYLASMCLYKMTEETMVKQLGREPFPSRLVAELPKLRRPACLAVLTLFAAIGVVATR